MKHLIEIKEYYVIFGTNIKTAIKEAKEIAKINHCIVRFEFNDVILEIDENTNEDEIIKKYNEEFGKIENEKLKRRVK